jgi:hypothetical protein
MKTKFLGICIVIAALLISCAIALSTIIKLFEDTSDRYSFYVDTDRRIVYTFDKYTGEYSKGNAKTVTSGKWNDIR